MLVGRVKRSKETHAMHCVDALIETGLEFRRKPNIFRWWNEKPHK